MINKAIMSNDEIQLLLENYPFLTLATYGSEEYLGIVQNQDSTIISMYVFDEIRTTELRKDFLEFGEQWWWETNRLIPINIIMGDKFLPFSHCLRSFNLREFNLVNGPIVCLRNIIKTKPRRKNIKLIRKVD